MISSAYPDPEQYLSLAILALCSVPPTCTRYSSVLYSLRNSCGRFTTCQTRLGDHVGQPCELAFSVGKLSRDNFLSVFEAGSFVGTSLWNGCQQESIHVLARWTNQYGSVFKWSLIGQDILVITDPEEVYKLCSREANLPKARALYKSLNTVSSELYHSACLLLICTEAKVKC